MNNEHISVEKHFSPFLDGRSCILFEIEIFPKSNIETMLASVKTNAPVNIDCICMIPLLLLSFCTNGKKKRSASVLNKWSAVRRQAKIDKIICLHSMCPMFID